MHLRDFLLLSVSEVLSYTIYEVPEKPSGHLIAKQFAGLHLKSLNCPFFFFLGGGHGNLWPQQICRVSMVPPSTCLLSRRLLIDS